MKIRNGFISNSSSSSFVVAFPRKPQSEHELQDMMFTRFQEVIQPYDHAVTKDEICRVVFREIYEQEESALAEEITDTISGLYYQDMYDLLGQDWDQRPNQNDFNTKEEYYEATEGYYEERSKRAQEYERKQTQEFIDKNKDGFILCTSYADEDGSFWSTMEHGDIFRNLDHIRVSNH